MNSNIEWVLEMETMLYFDRPDDTKLSANLLKKKYDIINNNNNEYMATQKWDGYWMMFIKGDNENEIWVRGRNKNKAGYYENYAIKVPHLVEEMHKWPNNTVVIGEICWPDLTRVATDVGIVLRCLPAKAVERQQIKKLVVKAFDIIMLDGERCDHLGYYDRYNTLANFASHFDVGSYFALSQVAYDDFLGFADDIIRRGGEGCVIQRKDHPYEPGKRSAWQTLKLKQRLDTAKYKVVEFLEPRREYDGKCSDSWEYRIKHSLPVINEKGIPTGEYYEVEELVTKPFYFGWKIGVTVELPSGKRTDVSSGLSDADREWLSTDEAQSLLEQGKLYANIRAMQEATLGGLRHPVFEGWEYDKDGQY